MDEEWALLTHYLSNVFDIYPNYYNAIDYRSVQYSVCSYVKRFFMKRSILQYNPKLICAGAYMLALKVLCILLLLCRWMNILPLMLKY